MDEHLEIDDDPGMPDESIHISDVLEVIETDPDFQESNMSYNGGREIPRQQQQHQHPQHQPTHRRSRPVLRIVEQPASKALRFRYECEGRSAGSIPGASSTPENKTFPAVQVEGYKGGRAVVVVSCVTKDEPYRPHPHNLVGREGCKKGVCTMEIPKETMCVTFSNLGIQCVKKKDIESALLVRESIKVDPFSTGFDHRSQPASIDLNAVRLCFQVFLEAPESPGSFKIPLRPVVSQPIYDKKAMSDLVIVKLSHCVCYADGGRNDIILLCEKVAKEDIQVRFFEECAGRVAWEANGDFQPSQVHKQTAISFRPPPYHTRDITEPVKVFIQLKRPSDGMASEPLPFEYLPLDSDSGVKRKKHKFDEHVVKRLENEKLRLGLGAQQQFLNIPMDPIKIEPRDKTPSPYGGQVYGASPNYAMTPSVSPHYMDPTPPPPGAQNQVYGNLPHFESMMPSSSNWIHPSTSRGATNNIPVGNWAMAAPMVQNDLSSLPSAQDFDEHPSGVSNLLNLDNQQLVFNNTDLNFDPNNLSETFSNISCNDIIGGGNRSQEDQNMDSFTRVSKALLDDLCKHPQ